MRPPELMGLRPDPAAWRQAYTWALPAEAATKAYTAFRVLQTGPNSNRHYYLALGGLELYGKIVAVGN